MGWIRSLPCSVCGTTFWVEAAHVGDKAFGHKCPDEETIPLCVMCHREGKFSHHKMGRYFFEHHGIDKAALIERLQNAWRLLKGEM